MIKEELSKYERARLIGARALQISMGAPILIKLKKEDFESLNYNPINIAKKELALGVLPMRIKKGSLKKS